MINNECICANSVMLQVKLIKYSSLKTYVHHFLKMKLFIGPLKEDLGIFFIKILLSIPLKNYRWILIMLSP